MSSENVLFRKWLTLYACREYNETYSLTFCCCPQHVLQKLKSDNRGWNNMIKSMTGFGRCEVQKDSRKFTVELKGVNHRYLDVNIRMPKKLNFFETAIRALLKSYVSRGKVDIFITYEDSSQAQVSVKYNAALAAE